MEFGQKKIREIDLFDLTSFFGLWTFLNFLAHCAPNINEYLKKVLKNLNHTNGQLKNALEIIDDLILGPYQKIGHFGYFYKWNQLMDYQRHSEPENLIKSRPKNLVKSNKSISRNFF